MPKAAPRPAIAVIDIPPPGVAGNVGVFAFRAGDEIPAAWLDQHADYLADLAEVHGRKDAVVKRGPAPAEAAPEPAGEDQKPES